MRQRKICSIDGCDNGVRSLGFCNKHYVRFRDGKDMNPKVESRQGQAPMAIIVSMLHKVDECVIWPYARNNYGYAIYDTKDGRTQLSRTICEIKHGPPPEPHYQAAHSCGKGHEGCYNWNHLSWKTPIENQADRVDHGTMVRGEAVYGARLTEKDIPVIRRLISEGHSLASIGKMYGVTHYPIYAIKIGKTWKHV